MNKKVKKSLIGIVIFLVFLGALPLIASLFIEKEKTFQKKIEVPYDPENVWIFITHVENYPKWLPFIKEVQVITTNPQGLNSWREYYRSGRPVLFQVTEAEAYSYIEIKTADPLVYFRRTVKISIKETETGTSVEMKEDVIIPNPYYRFFEKIQSQKPYTEIFLNSLESALKSQ